MIPLSAYFHRTTISQQLLFVRHDGAADRCCSFQHDLSRFFANRSIYFDLPVYLLLATRRARDASLWSVLCLRMTNFAWARSLLNSTS